MSNHNSIIQLYQEESSEDIIDAYNKHNKLMEEFTTLYKKYKHKNEKCKM